LNFLLGGSFAAWAAVVAYPVLRYLKPPAESGEAGEAQLSNVEKHKLAQESLVIIRLGSARVIVFQDSRKNLKALAAKCTHEGCTVTYQTSEDLIWCPCHNGKFSTDGRVISGPPPRPLPAYKVTGDLLGTVTVSRQGA
jgi:Rieske Fe-S protein